MIRYYPLVVRSGLTVLCKHWISLSVSHWFYSHSFVLVPCVILCGTIHLWLEMDKQYCANTGYCHRLATGFTAIVVLVRSVM